MRKAADLYPGRAKTDKRDAFIIADTARTMPHTLRAVDRNNEVLSALKMLSGFDDDIARDCTRTINQLRSVLIQIYPSLERIFAGSPLTRTPVLELLIHYKGPQGLKRTGYHRVRNWILKHTSKDPTALVDALFDALKAQTVTVPGADTAEVVIPQLAANIKQFKAQRATTAAKILLAIGDGSDFDSASHLAAYAGIAPVTRKSSSSVRGQFPARSGNKPLKTRCFTPLSPLYAATNPSHQYYKRKRTESKRHNATIIYLARRRCNVIYAMLKNKEFFREIPPRPVAA